MQHGRIDGFTNELGRQQGYVPLYVRFGVEEYTDNMQQRWATPKAETAWFPTVEELEKLNQGAPVILILLNSEHPPVRVEVGAIPKEEDDGISDAGNHSGTSGNGQDNDAPQHGGPGT